MADRISPREFLAAPGVEDWRLVSGGQWAYAHFRTGSFDVGAALVAEIAALAGAANHHPDVDLRYASVAVRLSSHDVRGLSARDVTLARQVSVAARELGVEADPAAVQRIQVAIDALDIAAVLPFWQAVLGYAAVGDADLVDPAGTGPPFWFQQMESPRPQRNRIHVDVYLAVDQVEARLAAAIAAGGRMVSDAHAPDWWTLADPEGNEVDLAVWLDD